MKKVPRIFRILRQKRTVSPIISTVIIFALIIIGVAILVGQALPFLQQLQAESSVSAMKSSFLRMDQAITEMMSDSSLSSSGNSPPSRTIHITKPQGVLQTDTTTRNIEVAFGILETRGTTTTEYLFLKNTTTSDNLGYFDYLLGSGFSLLPKGSRQYMIGSEPLRARSPAVITPAPDPTEDQNLANITLSVDNNGIHHLTFGYRIRIVINIQTVPKPVLAINMYAISLSSTVGDISEPNKEVTLTMSIFQVNQTVIPISEASGRTSLSIFYQEAGTKRQILWDDSNIEGLKDALELMELQFNFILYKVTLSE